MTENDLAKLSEQSLDKPGVLVNFFLLRQDHGLVRITAMETVGGQRLAVVSNLVLTVEDARQLAQLITQTVKGGEPSLDPGATQGNA